MKKIIVAAAFLALCSAGSAFAQTPAAMSVENVAAPAPQQEVKETKKETSGKSCCSSKKSADAKSCGSKDAKAAGKSSCCTKGQSEAKAEGREEHNHKH